MARRSRPINRVCQCITRMPVTIEEEVVLLYTLYHCGRKPSKGRATQFIITNHLLKSYEGDFERVSTGERRVENRIAWTRQNLKDKGELSMPDHGTWAITQTGVERVEKIALRSLNWEEPKDKVSALLHEIQWDRFSDEFLKRLKALGANLKHRQENSGAVPNSRPPQQLPSSAPVQPSDSQRTSSSDICG